MKLNEIMNALRKAGLSDQTNDLERESEVNRFLTEMNSAKSMGKALESLRNDPSVDNQTKLNFVEALGKKWKDDPQVIAKLDKEIEKSPALGQALLAAIKTNPQGTLQALSRYNGNLSQSLQGLTPTVAPAQSAAPATPAPLSVPSTTPAAPAAVSPTAGTTNAPAVPPVAVVVPGNAAPSAPTTPSAPASSTTTAGGTPSGFSLQELLELDDTNLKAVITPKLVQEKLAPALAKIAREQGVPSMSTSGFEERIKRDDKLAKDIADALKRNPSSIRAIAAAIQETNGQDTSMTGKLKGHVIKSELTSIMNNPQKLASDDYLQSVERLTKQNDIFKALGFDKMFGGMFGGAGFSRFADQFACFTGPNKVFSICTSPGGFLPSIMINQGAMADNRIHALFRQFENPQDMKLLPNNGKLFLDKMEGGKPVLDKDGKPVQELNTVEIKLADGSTKKIVPANSPNYTAKQAQGGFSAGGEYIPGNIWVSVITGVDPKTQLPNKIDRVAMTPQQFEDYQKLIAKNSGGQEQIPFQSFTVADANKFRQDVAQATTQNTVRYDPATGQALPPVATPATGAQTFPVRPQTQIEDRRLETVT
jgi:hypothetical protein